MDNDLPIIPDDEKIGILRLERNLDIPVPYPGLNPNDPNTDPFKAFLNAEARRKFIKAKVRGLYAERSETVAVLRDFNERGEQKQSIGMTVEAYNARTKKLAESAVDPEGAPLEVQNVFIPDLMTAIGMLLGAEASVGGDNCSESSLKTHFSNDSYSVNSWYYWGGIIVASFTLGAILYDCWKNGLDESHPARIIALWRYLIKNQEQTKIKKKEEIKKDNSPSEHSSDNDNSE